MKNHEYFSTKDFYQAVILLTKELELSTEEKSSFQETMEEFVEEVSDFSDFGPLNIFPDNVDLTGKVIDFDIEFYYTIAEDNGVYINGDMVKLDDNLLELINKLTNYYHKFKSKWAPIVSRRKRMNRRDDEEI